jgi:hypothetical protein
MLANVGISEAHLPENHDRALAGNPLLGAVAYDRR